MNKNKSRLLGLMVSSSLLALVTGGNALAQTAPAKEAKVSTEENAETVVVIGVRNAERSAIQRKKRSSTHADSIVADDVGQFPDKNVGEAISRIAGVALDITDAGDQGGFTIRGQAADLIRIEVDGMSMLPLDNQNGRSVTGLNDMSSDLIKSVDVIKGQTADMRPGGVGGTVLIEQRNGLDFKKPLVKFNLQYQKNTLDEEWSPRANLILTKKFLNDKLGILFNFTHDDARTSTDFNSVSDKQIGYQPFGDHDNSAEKSFTQAYDPIAAAVTTKAGCAALPTTGINSRLNCYAQWEDFAPSLPRMRRENRQDVRTSFQLRADYRVNDSLTVYASYNPNIRNQDFQAYNFFIASPNGTTSTAGVLSSNMRNVKVNENHYITEFDFIRGNGSTNLNYDTQVRDIQRTNEQHYSQIGANFKKGKWTAKAAFQYATSKGERQDEAFKFITSIPSAHFYMIPENGLWTFDVPAVDLNNPSVFYPVSPDNNSTTPRPGVFQNPTTTARTEFTPQADRNKETNFKLDVVRKIDNFGPLKSVKFGVSKTDRENETWREGGFLIAPGITLSRARSLDYIRMCNPTVVGANCQFGSRTLITDPLSTSTDRLDKEHMLTVEQYQRLVNESLIDLPGANYFDGLPERGNLINSWKTFNFDSFYNILSQYADLSRHNLDCLYECIASDGKVYKRPSYSTQEGTTSAYLMGDFETRLFNMEVTGNIGVRYQKIEVNAAPSINFFNRVLDTAKVTANNKAPYTDVFVSRTVGVIDRESEDVLPSFNLAVWPIEDKLVTRYSIAKQRARPSMTNLTGTSAANCFKLDQALTDFYNNNPAYFSDGDPDTEDPTASAATRCSGRIGNPELKGYEAITQNLSMEWYPNKDSQLSLAYFEIDVKTQRPETVSLPEYELQGTKYIADTFQDGPGGLKQTGFEVSGRTAFTYLPSVLRYTGGGFNYSTAKSNLANTAKDPLTGIALPPRGESSYYYNVNLWYDDGRTNARIAYQQRDFYYDRIDASESINRVPNAATAALIGIPIDPTGAATSYFKTVTPIFKNGSKSLDARISYKINKNIEIFAEGKNLLNDSITRYAPDQYREIGNGTPYVFDTLYYGQRFYFGFISTF